jgi:hypothetical protein
MSQPVSLTRAVAAHGALVALGLVSVVLTVVLQDSLIRSWAEGKASVRDLLASGGVDAVKAGDIAPPSFIPVAVTLFIVLVGLIWVLVAFLKLGYGWSRPVLTGLLVFMAVATVAGIRTSPPVVFDVLGYLSFVLEVPALFFLWQPDTSAHLRGTWSADGQPDSGAVDAPA